MDWIFFTLLPVIETLITCSREIIYPWYLVSLRISNSRTVCFSFSLHKPPTINSNLVETIQTHLINTEIDNLKLPHKHESHLRNFPCEPPRPSRHSRSSKGILWENPRIRKCPSPNSAARNTCMVISIFSSLFFSIYSYFQALPQIHPTSQPRTLRTIIWQFSNLSSSYYLQIHDIDKIPGSISHQAVNKCISHLVKTTTPADIHVSSS